MCCVPCDSPGCDEEVEVEDPEQDDPIFCPRCAEFWIMIMNRGTTSGTTRI